MVGRRKNKKTISPRHLKTKLFPRDTSNSNFPQDKSIDCGIRSKTRLLAFITCVLLPTRKKKTEPICKRQVRNSITDRRVTMGKHIRSGRNPPKVKLNSCFLWYFFRRSTDRQVSVGYDNWVCGIKICSLHTIPTRHSSEQRLLTLT